MKLESLVSVWIARLRWTTLIVAATTACVPSHAMRQQHDDGSCPARRVAPTSAGEALAWSGPTNLSDLERHNVWCRTVGPPVLRPLPSPRLAASDQADRLAVLTWNVYLGGGDLVTFLAEELGFACGVPETDESVFPFHFVVLLQEVHRASPRLPVVEAGRTIPWRIAPTPPSGDRLDISEVAERCGLALVYVPSARNGPNEGAHSPEDKGNAILSTLPVTGLAAIELPFEADRKVAVAATISWPGGDRIRVTSVHLDLASTLARTLSTGNETRLRQAMGLVEALDSMESLPTVVGGDFNTWSAHESVMRRLAIEFPDSPAWDGQTTRGPFPTDHMLFRTSQGSPIHLVESSYRKISERYGSDHAARILWLRGHDAGPLRHPDEVRQ